MTVILLISFFKKWLPTNWLIFEEKTHFYLIFWISRNPTKQCWEDKQITLLFYTYTIHFSNSSLFFISDTLSSDPFSFSAMVIQFSCGICSKAVANNHQAIKCDKCNLWIHIKCNKINKQTYNYLKSDSSHWFCISCTKEFLPFSGIEDGEFAHATLGKKLSLPMFQTHQNQSEKISFKLFIQKITEVRNLLLMI